MSINIESYNAEWPSRYEHILEGLNCHLRDISDVTLAHIGSTAVPSLCGLAVIDILITVPSARIDEIWSVLSSVGYEACLDRLESQGVILDTHAKQEQYAHTIFLCGRDSLAARAHITIRNTLLTDPDLRTEYADLKSRTQDACQNSPPTYSDIKTTFLQQLLIASHHFKSEDLPLLLHSTAEHRWDPLTTYRLVLREFTLADIDGLFKLESNPANARYQSWEPWTRAEAQQNVVRGIHRSYGTEREVVELSVVHGGDFIGRIGGRIHGVSDARAQEGGEKSSDASPQPETHIDLWFSFLSSAQGKGLATEAMQAFIAAVVLRQKERRARQGETYPPLLELEIECDPRNTKSWGLAERLGFKRHSLTERAWECKGEWVGSLVYRREVSLSS